MHEIDKSHTQLDDYHNIVVPLDDEQKLLQSKIMDQEAAAISKAVAKSNKEIGGVDVNA